MIVGVVGGNNESEHTLDLAKLVGRTLAGSGHVVLTGGHHRGKKTQVKVAALRGAKQVGTTDRPARILGVLPEANQNVERRKETGRWNPAYLQTTLGSGRNLLNGLIPDAVVAVRGGPGTVSEIYFALAGGRPVVLLGWEPADVVGEIADHENAARFNRYLGLAELGPKLIDKPADVPIYLVNHQNVFIADAVDTAVALVERHGLRDDEGHTALQKLKGTGWADLEVSLREKFEVLGITHTEV